MDHFLLFIFHVCLCYAAVSVLCSLVITYWEGRTSWLFCVIFSYVLVTFPYGVPGKVWYLIVSIPNLCPLPYFYSKPSSACYVSVGNVWEYETAY